MIPLTRLNGTRFVLNADLIRTVETRPDTVITLAGGEHIVVAEPLEEVVRRVIRYGRSLRHPLGDNQIDPACWTGGNGTKVRDPAFAGQAGGTPDRS